MEAHNQGRCPTERALSSSFPYSGYYGNYKYKNTERDKEYAGPPALARRVYETHALDSQLIAAGQQRRAHVAVPGRRRIGLRPMRC